MAIIFGVGGFFAGVIVAHRRWALLLADAFRRIDAMECPSPGTSEEEGWKKYLNATLAQLSPERIGPDNRLRDGSFTWMI